MNLTIAMNPFEQALSSDHPVILDGGLATELEQRGHDISTHLWSAALLQTDPQAIIDVARAFLEAGAQCVTSASYQASRGGFIAQGLSAEEADALMLLSVELAVIARQQHLRANPQSTSEPAVEPFVAASIGPWGAAQADGSEYTGRYRADETELREFHQLRLRLFDHSTADVLACETIPNRLEAVVLCDLLRQVDTPAWISFCCTDASRISDGTPLREVARLFRQHPRVAAIGVNCTEPKLIVPLIGELRAGAPDKAVIVYPNSGESYDVASHNWSGTARPEQCAIDAVKWREAGASMIGGCCRTRPQHIAAIRRVLADHV
jgi:homocysteine S-methyltransferase